MTYEGPSDAVALPELATMVQSRKGESMNRRSFLASALAAPVAARANGRTVRIGFLGGSHSHATGKVEVVLASREYELVGMWEDDPALQVRYKAKGVRFVSSEQLLRDPAIEVIAVESPVRDHTRHARMVLEAGKHLHLEKPPALDVESLRSILDLAARKKRIVQMGYMWRHHPGINAMIEAARNGWLGDVYMVKAIMNKKLSPDQRPAWAEFRGGQMFELGGHVIDPLIRLMGRPDRVTPFLQNDSNLDNNMADNTIAVFEFPNALGLVVGAALHHSSRYRSFTVQGTKGTATLRPIEPPELIMDLTEAAGPYAKGRQKVDLPPYKRYVDDFVELAAAVRGGKPIAVTPHEDLIVQEALIAASAM